MTFLEELWAVGTLTDDHDTEYDGEHYTSPSLPTSTRSAASEMGSSLTCT